MRPIHPQTTMSLQTLPGRTNRLIGALQVNVVDYKPYKNPREITQAEVDALREYTRKLVMTLRKFTNFMTPGDDKVQAVIELKNNELDEALHLDLLLGSIDDPFIKPIALPLPKIYQGLRVTNLHEALATISTPQPGGNVPNMIRNLTHVMHGRLLPEDMQILLHYTEEPLFMEWFKNMDPSVRDRITLKTMDIPSRKGLHLPYRSDLPGGVGTLGIITPMHSAHQVMGDEMADLAECNHVLVSESLGQLVTSKLRRYNEFQNPSSAFRKQCALDNYNMTLGGGHIPTVSLNDEEMVIYLQCIEERRDCKGSILSSGGSDTEQRKIKDPYFGSPFDEHRALNETTAALVTESLQRYFTCIPTQNEAHTYFPLSVSCGPYGGYHICCTPDAKRYGVFSSTPHGDGAQKMLDIIGPSEEISINTKRTMGAGDAVASILSIAHLVDVEQLMGELKTPHHPISKKFIEIAASIFVSLLSRFAGEILYHTNRCDWMGVPPEKFRDIIAATARKSLDLAAETWNGIDQRPMVTREPEWDIDVAMWQL